MKGASFCYIHSLGRIQNVPIWKNATLHVVVGLITTLIIAIVSCQYTASRSTQAEIFRQVEYNASLLDDIWISQHELKSTDGVESFKMTRKNDLLDIDLNEELAAIRAQKGGKAVLRKKKLNALSDVATIRYRLGLTQEAFSGLLGISVQTLRNWEQGTREPRGPAKALLRIVEKNPKVLFS